MDPKFPRALNTLVINKRLKFITLSINCEGILGILHNIRYIAY